MLRSEIIDRLLAARGVSPEERDAFLHPSLSGLAAPEELPGITQAADAILAAVGAGRKIVVFGDYDCDGVSATAILVKAIRALGGENSVATFIPDRLSEGYGMSDAAVARCMSVHPDVGLVVTVDNGINSISQIAALKGKGVNVVVTDHHLASRAEGRPDGEFVLPPADAVVNPKVSAPAHLADLCGAGVAFFLANKVVSDARRRGMYSGPNLAGPLLVLAGLATVTDIMPLLGQNRILVSEALSRFRTLAPTGLKELHLRAARNGSDRLTSRDFGFMLGPRINAAGRLKSGMEALDLILSEDREAAREQARVIDEYNLGRKSIEREMTDRAMEMVVPGASAQVIDLPDGHPGVVGIVAARVMERMERKTPVCVIAGGHGSARSPDGVNIRDAFVACDAFLEKYGGHAAACGFSVKEGMTDAFRDALCRYCDSLGVAAASTCDDGDPELWIEPEDVTIELAEAIEGLEPFGEGNREPVLGFRNAFLSDVRPLGSDGQHLYVSISAGTSAERSASRLRAVWWNRGDLVESLRASSSAPHSLKFNVVASDYGERHPELRLVGIS